MTLNEERDHIAETIGVLIAQQKDDPLAWAKLHRRMKTRAAYSINHEPFRFPFLQGIYDAIGSMPNNGRVVVQKAAQIGLTEVAINVTFWFMDQKQEHVLYMLPSQNQESDFASERLDMGAINCSPYIKKAFSDVANVRLKLGWGQALYLRGSQATANLISIPVGFLVRDEYDRMLPEGRELAETRLGASRYKWKLDLSNPSAPEIGINEAFLRGSQHEWIIACPKGHSEPVTWPDSIKDGQIVCPECQQPIDVTQGEWRPQKTDAPYKSFHLTQLLSPLSNPEDMEQSWKEAQGDLTKLEYFYNFVLGLPYAAAGVDISDGMIRRAIGKHRQHYSSDGTYMGIDVGATNWYVAMNKDHKIINCGSATWEELERLMGDLGVKQCGIEMEPEITRAKAFASKFPDRVFLIDYRGGHTATETQYKELDDGKYTLIMPNRTEIIDEALSYIRRGEQILPLDTPPMMKKHLKALRRRQRKVMGRDVYLYQSEGADHLCHAMTFAHLAWKQQSTPRGPAPMPSRLSKISVWRRKE